MNKYLHEKLKHCSAKFSGFVKWKSRFLKISVPQKADLCLEFFKYDVYHLEVRHPRCVVE